jgi:hypothetical protein
MLFELLINFRFTLDLYVAFLFYVYIVTDALQINDCFLTLPLRMEFTMSHHVTTVQICFEKVATTYNAALTITDRIYQIDEIYVQPFYRWIAPRLRDAALSGLCWALIALFDIAHWLNDVTQRSHDHQCS